MQITKTLIAAAIAGLAATPALAIDRFDSGNSSLVFVAVDSTGTPASILVDLGIKFSDFDPVGVIPESSATGLPGFALAPGTTITWNFTTDVVTVNGAPVAGNYQYSSQFSIFQNNAQADQTSYGVMAGATGGFPTYFLTTGNPTQTQLNIQTVTDTTNMANVEPLLSNNAGKGTTTGQGGTQFGANAVINTITEASGYVLANGNLGSSATWQTTLKWSAIVPEGVSTNVFVLNDDSDLEAQLDGQFSYASGVLTWQAAPIPEPGTYALLLAGLAVVSGIAARRRRAG